jgi:hypothetical protein
VALLGPLQATPVALPSPRVEGNKEGSQALPGAHQLLHTKRTGLLCIYKTLTSGEWFQKKKDGCRTEGAEHRQGGTLETAEKRHLQVFCIPGTQPSASPALLLCTSPLIVQLHRGGK